MNPEMYDLLREELAEARGHVAMINDLLAYFAAPGWSAFARLDGARNELDAAAADVSAKCAAGRCSPEPEEKSPAR